METSCSFPWSLVSDFQCASNSRTRLGFLSLNHYNVECYSLHTILYVIADRFAKIKEERILPFC